ncbi:uncharacterized protein (DUF342 family) [Hypnocyclicus thermotrophus]|uniref:Uncharacterized protein (DUF342 family) n=1 Tax=Hypnocyclicus thermotrophus TaxID=1627895 RepID=A0AA46DWX6_9FUSO|nr:FapA family protein [Hypnocyclicus thermotrophus]TDT67364.1 uncharacterized protein (DUF342 family) [Hypnocyclicus thermotrophus]
MSEKFNKVILRVAPDGVYIKIKNEPMSISSVLAFLNQTELDTFDLEAVKQAYFERGVEVKISDNIENLKKIPDIEIKISDDKMKAYLKIKNTGFIEFLSLKYLLEKAYDIGISYGINKKVLLGMIKYDYRGKFVLFAEGTPPIKGKDAMIHYKFMPKKNKDEDNPNNKIDYKERNDLFIPVKKDQILAEKTPATQGTDGIDIFGNIIPAIPGQDKVLKRGENTQLIHNGLTLVAAISGLVDINGDTISVKNILIVNDVNIKTGNIDFEGTVLVNGNVDLGYRIKADNDIRIKGVIEGAILEAGKNVIIEKNFIGSEVGKIIANHSIKIRDLEFAYLEAKENIIITDSAVNCQILAGKSVEAIQGKGIIMGGEIIAIEGLSTKILGSKNGLKTIIKTGKSISVKEAVDKIDEYKSENKKRLINIEKSLEYMENLRFAHPESFDEEKKKQFNRLLNEKLAIEYEVKSMVKDIANNLKNVHPTEGSLVKVYKICYPGVEIWLNKYKYVVTKIMKHVEFVYINNKIEIRPLRK